MLIKVCGIKTKENIDYLQTANIDMIGLNFYKPSVRYIVEKTDPSLFDNLPNRIKKIGVFVNEDAATIEALSHKFNLDYAQLHGDEDASFCDLLANKIPVIKVFRIDDTFDFTSISQFEAASFYLFDTQTKKYGGSGKKFDWEMLEKYTGSKPFLLSGGIGPKDYHELLEINHPQFVGIDINSKFESSPGIKDDQLLDPFIASIRNVH